MGILDTICPLIVQIANLLSGIPVFGGILNSVLGSVFEGIGCEAEEAEA